jgi:UDP-N-acetylmuramoyl-L-alanyl-D-glutamate--2,6-diaminopimelate ligase
MWVELETVVEALPQFVGVPGRMERVQIKPEQDVSVIVDYAHTPDSLENLLKASRPFIQGKMICVFGCGGDRDRTKRPKMGKIAAELADVAVVTSDNPRTEDPERILQDILEGYSAIREAHCTRRSRHSHSDCYLASSAGRRRFNCG